MIELNLTFQVDVDGNVVNLQRGNVLIPLFPADRLDPDAPETSLQEAVATVMQDLEPEDNGVV
jgi:hypothetical protein